jgi:2-dehydro-3-deoxygluconokinase
MPVYVGGAELNVATALAKWKVPVKYVTVLPKNDLSTDIVAELEAKQIDTSSIVFSGDRIGIYFLPQGGDLKGAGVIYDRAYSSFSELRPGMIDWEKVLDGCSWFHFSAISPALNKNVADVCLEGLKIAEKKGLKISVDLNFRAKLWKYGSLPVDIMPEMMEHCNVIMGNIWAVESLLGIPSPLAESKGRSKNELMEAAGSSMSALHKRYPKAETFAFTYRLENNYWAVIQHGKEMQASREFSISNVVDRVGSGDCFMGALIYGLYSSHQPKSIIDFAAAAAVGKLFEKGDVTDRTVENVNEFLIKNGKE